MEGPSSKEAVIYSNNPGSHSMDTLNHPAPPPPYQANSSYPHPNPGPAPTVIQHPPVEVTEKQNPGATMTQQQYSGATVIHQQYPGATVIHQQYPGATVIEHPGLTITQQPGVIVSQPGAPVTATAIVGNTMVHAVYMRPILGHKASLAHCGSCNHQMTTRVEYQAGADTHIVALILCLTLMWPCIFIPYCVNNCKAAQHYCSNCGAYIGVNPV